MKSLIFRILLATLMLAPIGLLHAQTDINTLVSGIKSGNTDALSLLFANNVDILLGDDEGSVTKAEAVTKTKRFFATNTPKGFVVKHQGNKNGSQYIVGSLSTSGGSYDTYVVLRAGQIVEFCIE